MSAPSPVVICNRALTLVGGNTITSLSDPESNEAALCSLHYPGVRDAATEAYNWSHARTRFGPLVSDPTKTPAFGFSYAFLLPGDMLTLQWAGVDPEGVIELPTYSVENGYLLANEESGINISYLRQVTDTTKFTYLFTEAVIARLAAELAVPLAESRSLAEQMFKLYQAKVDEAAAVDGMQGRNERTTAARHQRARWGNGAQGLGFYTAGG